jgi:putative endonuclease
MKYYIYILHSISADKYYVEPSNNPERRLQFHNAIEKGFTSRYRPWQLAFQKEFPFRLFLFIVNTSIKINVCRYSVI